MTEYYPGDVVIRTKVAIGMTGRIIKLVNREQRAYDVEVLYSPNSSEMKERQVWQAIYFELLEMEPDWEV